MFQFYIVLGCDSLYPFCRGFCFDLYKRGGVRGVYKQGLNMLRLSNAFNICYIKVYIQCSSCFVIDIVMCVAVMGLRGYSPADYAFLSEIAGLIVKHYISGTNLIMKKACQCSAESRSVLSVLLSATCTQGKVMRVCLGIASD